MLDDDGDDDGLNDVDEIEVIEEDCSVVEFEMCVSVVVVVVVDDDDLPYAGYVRSRRR
jgi:hypothetical protein